ncbi:MAG: hypothetical protein LBR10_08685 [Prevotellaceae bacterium]|jgi:hypothetical protein|nr:hypothetical protein [Prevotellaceae bacterium]
MKTIEKMLVAIAGSVKGYLYRDSLSTSDRISNPVRGGVFRFKYFRELLKI